MQFIIILLLFILFISVLYVIHHDGDKIRKIIKEYYAIYQKTYIIKKDQKDQKSVNSMEKQSVIIELRNRLQKLVDCADTSNDEFLLGKLSKKTIDSLTIVENSKESYTINKKSIHLCLADNDGKLYNINNLTYVLLHELSHVLCDEEGHTSKFNQIFDKVIEYSINCGIYDPSIKMPQVYCNLKIY